ncbi:MAG: TIGR04279 domain-containing protein [Euryarchaeota archaeon]|nr:TIGR04279 domain-containing protein [Euryarchaeota archaeon]
MACCEKTDAKPIAKPIACLNFTDEVVYFLDHTSSPTDGNWIVMGNPKEGTRIQLPKPIKLTYNGPKHIEYDGVSGTLYKCEEESYTITYPSTKSYTTHPVFLPNEDVKMSFYGEPGLKNEEVEIYLINLFSDSYGLPSSYGLFGASEGEDIGSINAFKGNVGVESKKHIVKLDECGDISNYNLGPLDAGQYCIVMVSQNEDNSITVLSATAFMVVEHELCISAPSCITKGNDLDISTSLKGATADDYTYGAVLIKDEAYKADIEINSDGTEAGTSVIVNGMDIIDVLDNNQTFLDGKVAIAIGEAGQNTLSLSAFDLPAGCYYLLVGAYNPEKGLVGLSQKTVKIEEKSSKIDDKKDKGDCTKPEKNIEKKIANLNFTDKVVYFLDHTSSPTDGNWIVMGCLNEGTRIQLPKPIKLTYNGPEHMEYGGVSGTLYGGVSGTLYKCEEESSTTTYPYTITYPSTKSYTTHPVFLPTEKVKMSFYGEPGLKNEIVEIYRIKLTSDCAYGLLDAFDAGDIGSINTLFKDSVGEEYEKHTVKLDECGDIVDYNLGELGAGPYCVVMVRQNKDKSMTVLSATAFLVAEYELCISAPSCIIKGNDLDISMSLKGATADDYTYGAVLIKDEAYKADIEINSDGTGAGTSVIVNGMDISDVLDNNQTFLDGKGTIAVGEAGQNTLSLTAFDLPAGCYYLLVGAHIPEKGLVGLSQKTVKIEAKMSSRSTGGTEKDPSVASNSKVATFYFKNAASPVTYIEFNSQVGRITAIAEELEGISSDLTGEPEGVVYKYLDIQVGDEEFSSSENIKSAIVGFRVSKEWINENHINVDTIVLQHYTEDRWITLKTEKVDEDDEYVNFKAETPGFSPFAITASKNVIGIEGKTGNEVQSSPESEQKDRSVVGFDVPSKENGSPWAKAASFFIGFLVIVLIGSYKRKK